MEGTHHVKNNDAFPLSDEHQSQLNIRHKQELRVSISTYIFKFGYKSVTSADFFQQKRWIHILDCYIYQASSVLQAPLVYHIFLVKS